jgi:hypothetical protein
MENTGQNMYLGQKLILGIEAAVAEPTKQWARSMYFPRAAASTRNLAVSGNPGLLPETRWTAFLSNDKDRAAIRMDSPTWIALGGFDLYINHLGTVERTSDTAYMITLEKRFYMEKNYNFAPNEPGKENNPAELFGLYFPDEWADEFETTGLAKRFYVYGSWNRTDEIIIHDYDCDGNWINADLLYWTIRRHVWNNSQHVSHSVNYQISTHMYVPGPDIDQFSKEPPNTKLIP